MSARRRWIALPLAALLIAPFTASASLASWTDREWVSASTVETTSFACDTQTGFASEASAQQVDGSLLGLDLATVAEVQGVDNEVSATGDETWGPPGAIDLDPGGAPAHTRAVSLAVGALSDVVGVSLPQITAGAPGLDVGALAQYAQVTERGTATAATGVVADQSGVITIGETSAAPPEPAVIRLSELLPAAEGIANVGLDVGAVSAMSQIDGCALLREAQWGIAAPADAVVRDYDIAGLDLVIDAPALSTIVTTVDDTVSSLQGALNSLQSSLSSGLTGVLDDLTVDLAVLRVSTGGTGVSVSAIPNVADAVSGLLTEVSDASGTIRLEPRAGQIVVDLAALLGGTGQLNGLAPNTELLLNDAVVNGLVQDIGTLLDSWTGDITSALETAVSGTQVDIDLSASVAAQLLVSIPVADVGISISADLGALATDDSLIDAGVSVALLGLDNPLLSAILGALLGVLNPLEGLLEGVITGAVDGVLGIVSSLGSTLSGATAPLITALATVLTPLADILSLQVNVQPDQPAPPPNAPAYTPATPTSSAQYLVTALRIGLLSPTDLNSILPLATASAGPVTMPSSG